MILNLDPVNITSGYSVASIFYQYTLSVVGPQGKLQGITKVRTSIADSSVFAFFLLQSGWLMEACRGHSGSPVSFSGNPEDSFLLTSSGPPNSGGLPNHLADHSHKV